MKTTSAVAQEFKSSGLRLDASFYASDGVQAMHTLQGWKRRGKQRRFDSLKDVCKPDGIFIPGRFRRIYVSDPKHGLPWLSPSDMLKADLSDLPFVSKKYTPIQDVLRLQKGWLLLSRSGSIGNVAYVRDDMVDQIGSDDIIRILADEQKIPRGYLFAFLGSAMGKALIQQQTYGAVIQHIESEHVKDLPIPRLESKVEEQIHDLIEQASDLRTRGNQLKQKAEKESSKLLGIALSEYQPRKYTSVKLSKIDYRFEANYHVASSIEELLRKSNYPLVRLKELLDRIFYLGKLHRVFVDNPKHGLPLLSISDVQKAKLSSEKFISQNLSRNVNDAVLKKGCILISRSGTPGIVTFVRSEMVGMVGTDHLIRLFPDETKLLNGYLFSFLSSSVGKCLLTRSVHGSVQLTLPPEYVSQIKLPLPPIKNQKPIHDLIDQYGESLSKASELENQAQDILAAALQT